MKPLAKSLGRTLNVLRSMSTTQFNIVLGAAGLLAVAGFFRPRLLPLAVLVVVAGLLLMFNT